MKHMPYPRGFARSQALAASRYGDDRRPNLPAAALAFAVAALLVAALVQAGAHRPQAEAAKLAVVNLSIAPPPAPPPTPPRETVPERAAPLVAPRPLIAAPDSPPALLAPPDPAPPPPVAVPPAPPAPPAPPTTIEASDLGTRLLSGAPPRYPRESRRHREQGTVVLALTLDVDGTVAAISVARSSGFERLDEAALRTVRKWRWAPTQRDGRAVRVKGLVEIPFVLREG